MDKGKEMMSIIEHLGELGFMLNKTNKLADITFENLAVKCTHRKETVPCTDISGTECNIHICTHPELKDKPFDRSCKLNLCPYVKFHNNL
jgi:hypothetical protein